MRVRFEDDASGAAAPWQHDGWKDIWEIYERDPDTSGVFWMRATVEIQAPLPPGEPLGLSIMLLASSEVYWNGHLIGQNGRVGRSEEAEVPGRLVARFAVPDSLAVPGTHALAIRASNFHSGGLFREGRFRFYYLLLGGYASLMSPPVGEHLLPALLLGALLVIGGYFVFAYVAGRWESRTFPLGSGSAEAEAEEPAGERTDAELLFGLLCLAVALLLAAEGFRWVVNYPYSWHFPRLQIIAAITTGLAVLLALYLSAQLSFPRPKALLASLAPMAAFSLLVPSGYDTKSLGLFASALLLSALVCVWAVRKRRPGGQPALLGISVCAVALVVDDYGFLDFSFFLIFGAVALFAMAALSVRRRRREQRAHLRAVRFEAALLKKHLEPHFLMNTLTSLLEWIEEDPRSAASFVEELASELRFLSEVSGEQHITLRKEVALCRAHLKVMGYRQACAFRLHTKGVDEDAAVPPAIFHTLLENALTHNQYERGEVIFRLSGERMDSGWRYVFEAPLGRASKSSTEHARYEEGTGLRYVRARLKESCGTQWSLDSGSRSGAWVTKIEICDQGEVRR